MSSSPSGSTSYTVVKHPPAPGWEFPPVPADCEPKFAVIRLGNTQHKVCNHSHLFFGRRVGDGPAVLIAAAVGAGPRCPLLVTLPECVPGKDPNTGF